MNRWVDELDCMCWASPDTATMGIARGNLLLPTCYLPLAARYLLLDAQCATPTDYCSMLTAYLLEGLYLQYLQLTTYSKAYIRLAVLTAVLTWI